MSAATEGFGFRNHRSVAAIDGSLAISSSANDAVGVFCAMRGCSKLRGEDVEQSRTQREGLLRAKPPPFTSATEVSAAAAELSPTTA